MKLTLIRWFSFMIITAGLLTTFHVAPLLAAKPAANQAGSSTQQMQTVNLNTADANALQQIRGIGPKMAERIIAYRTENGKFQTADELVNVRGIGPVKYEKMKSQVAV